MSHHHHSDYIDVVSAKGPQQFGGKMKSIFIAMAVAGILAFAVALSMGDSQRVAWIALLHNLYYFTGLSAGGMAIAAIMQVARSHWGRAVKRYAEAMAAFLPVSIIGVVILWIGAHTANGDHFIYEWVKYPPDPHHFHNKAFWLQPDFVFGRQVFALLLLLFLSWKFRSHSDRPDFGLASEKNSAWPAPSGWGNFEDEVEKSQQGQMFWGVIYCAAYAVCISLFAFDMLMSLDFRWISTMFGGWSFTSCLLQAWGMMVFITYWMSKRHGTEKYIHKKVYHDLGKLTFGFTIVWAYLFFAQLNVIWYGNLSHETGYLLTRFVNAPWKPLGWTVFAMVFLIPFLLGLGKQRKMSPKTFAPVVIISAVGLWLERFLLITPASWYYDRTTDTYEMGGIMWLWLVDVAMLIGFAGIFCLLYANYLYKRPVMVISDPRLDEGVNRH